MMISMNQLLFGDGLNETKSDLGGPPYLALSAGVAGRDGVRGPMALLGCVAKAEVWTISGRIHVVPLA
jgi:hypothetical protein